MKRFRNPNAPPPPPLLLVSKCFSFTLRTSLICETRVTYHAGVTHHTRVRITREHVSVYSAADHGSGYGQLLSPLPLSSSVRSFPRFRLYTNQTRGSLATSRSPRRVLCTKYTRRRLPHSRSCTLYAERPSATNTGGSGAPNTRPPANDTSPRNVDRAVSPTADGTSITWNVCNVTPFNYEFVLFVQPDNSPRRPTVISL